MRVCKFNKHGFCKYRDTCRNYHENEVCENRYCEVDSCTKRHPRVCAYFQLYKRCKFGTFCAYKHILKEDCNTLIDELRLKIEDLVEQISTLKREKNILENKVEVLEEKISDAVDEFKKSSDVIKNSDNQETMKFSTPPNVAMRDDDPIVHAGRNQLAAPPLGQFPSWSYKTP